MKQNQWGTVRYYWSPVLARGKAHVMELPENFPGDTPAGATILADRLLPALQKRFPNEALPRVVITDRGNGFYNGDGSITSEWKAGLAAGGFRPHQGDNAAVQPGTIGDLLAHETLVSWIRAEMTASIPRKPHEETRTEWYQRLRRAVAEANRRHDVEGLCTAWPKRLQEVVDQAGDVTGN